MYTIISRNKKTISYITSLIIITFSFNLYTIAPQARISYISTSYYHNLANEPIKEIPQISSPIIKEKTEYDKFVENDNKEIKKIIWDVSKEKGLDPNYILGICLIETAGTLNSKTLGPKTYCGRAKGLMQIMPTLEKDLKIKNIWDPEQNVKAGAAHLKWLIQEYSKNNIYNEHNKLIDSKYVAAIAYNWGHNNIDKMLYKYNCIKISKLPYETQRYYRLIKKHIEGEDIKVEL